MLKIISGVMILFALFQSALAEVPRNKGADQPQILQNEPLFKDGKGYYSYRKALDIPLPEDKVLIQYFYRYGCQICLIADDHLKQYAALHQDKVELRRSPAFDKDGNFTAKLNAAFQLFGHPELSDKYLFESADEKKGQRFVEDNEVIKRWLKQNQIDLTQFHQLFSSLAVERLVNNDRALFNRYSPPISPIAILNGKYILAQDTLYNDDYTYAVLDFLVEKLQQEQQLTQENK